MHMSLWQRVTGALATIGVALLTGYLVDRRNRRTGTHQSTPARLASPTATTGRTQHVASRVYATVEPSYLSDLFKNHTHVQAQKLVATYLGKWLECSGKVNDVRARDWEIMVFLARPQLSEPLVTLHLDTKWEPHLSDLRIGDEIAAAGRIEDVEANVVTLADCELVARPRQPTRDL